MTTTEAIGAILFIAGAFGFVGWMLTNLFRALRVARASQTPERRTPLPLVIVSAFAVFAVLEMLTDMATARRLALAGVILGDTVVAMKGRRCGPR